MRQKTNHFLIGTFVIAGSLLVVLGVIALGAAKGLRRALVVETCFAESVQGLEAGSPMRLRGVKIGEVQQILFANEVYATQHTYALVRIAISSGPFRSNDVQATQTAIAQLIAKGMRVRLASLGITGALYLEGELESSQRDPELAIDWQPAVPYVPSTPSLLGRVTSSVEAVLERLARTDFDGLIGEGRRTLTALAEATESLRASELRDELVEAARAARRVLEPLHERLPRAVTKLDETLQEVQDFARDARQAAGTFERMLTRAERALTSLEQSAAGGGRDLQGALADLRAVTETLRGLSETMARQPSLLLFGEPPKPVLERR